MRPLDVDVLEEIQDVPGVHTCKLCRSLNEKWTYYCGDKLCFANPRKRRTQRIVRADCEIPLSTLRNSLRRLIETGLIIKKREKRPDGRNNRGWDWMKCFYVV